MPCDTIQEAVVVLDKVNHNTLYQTLKKLGLNVYDGGSYINFSGYMPNGKFVSGTYRNGVLTFPDPSHKFSVKLIKQAYSAFVVEKEAERMKWLLKKKEENKYTATKPLSKDKIEIEILKDGTIKTITDKISPANHASAEQFLLNMAREAGGPVTRVRKAMSSSDTTRQKITQ